MRINIDESFFYDERITYLATLSNENRMITEARLLRVWASCYRDRSPLRTAKEIDRASCFTHGSFSDLMARSDLAKFIGPGEYSVCGVEDRIAYLLRMSEGGKKSARNRLEKYGTSQPNNAPEGSSKHLRETLELRSERSSSAVEPLPLPLSLDQKEEGEAIATSSLTPPDLLEIWNAKRNALPKAEALSTARKRAWNVRWREKPDKNYWLAVVTRLAASSFCAGDNPRGWRANLDFLLRPDTHLKVSEGQYDRKGQQPSTRSPLHFPEFDEPTTGGTHP